MCPTKNINCAVFAMNISLIASMIAVRFREQYENKENMQNFLPGHVFPINDTAGGGPEYPSLSMTIHVLEMYYTPLLVSIGIIGNMLTCLTLTHGTTCKSSATPYLTMLAISDICFLCVLLLVWLTSVLHVNIYNAGGWCQGITYVGYICAFLSVWLYVCMSVDRLIIICLPVRNSKLCSALRAKIVIISLTIVAIVVYLNISLMFGVVTIQQTLVCLPMSVFVPAIQVLNKLDAFINLLLPYAAVCVINLCIIRSIVEHYQRRNKIIRADHLHRVDICQERRSRVELQNTKLILAVSCVFLALNLPSHVLRLIVMISFFRGSQLFINRVYFWQRLLMQLFFTRFAINFFVHVGFSSLFRKSLRHLFSHLCKRKTIPIVRGKASDDARNGLQVRSLAIASV